MQSFHDALRRNLLSNWFLTLKMDALSTQLFEAPVFREETDVIYLHSCDLNTNYLLCNFLRLKVVFGQFIFDSSLGREASVYVTG